MEDPPHPERDRARTVLAYSQMGLQLALTVGAGVLLGRWADRRWGWFPWGLLSGSVVGVGVGLTVFILDALKLSRDEDKEERGRKPS